MEMMFIDREAFRKISVISDQKNRKYFLFFFVTALLGYASLLTLHFPYNDDYMRYLLNYSCGVQGRWCVPILEFVMFLSHIALDASPLTQIISCAILAFIALICVRIFCKSENKYEAALFVIIVVNPFVMANMMFRFDNMFMTTVLLCSVLAAYLSIENNSRNLPMQVIFLFVSLCLYQGALSAYFIVFIYLLIEKISKGEELLSIVKTMKYWIYAMAWTAFLYLPIALEIDYCPADRKVFGENRLIGYPGFIQQKILGYFNSMYLDWRGTYVGLMFSLFIIGFISYFFVRSWKNKSSYLDCTIRFSLLSLLTVAFFLAPMGITIFFNHAGNEGAYEISARIIYAIGIALSLIMRDSLIFFKKTFLFGTLSKVFSASLIVWNLFIANVTANLQNYNNIVQNDIARDIANDLYLIRKTNKISKIEIIYRPYLSRASVNALEKYPFLKRTLDWRWDKPLFSNALLKYNAQFYPIVRRRKIEDIKGSTKIADRMWYDLYLSENDTLVMRIKEPSN